ncbi:hypothetical protein LXA43DRAFT_1095796 [Ganoderma leucocontextum]|nr:hypothetical protein LXA43DRAFT_1095796 [Ganoderma leucocontextum]
MSINKITVERNQRALMELVGQPGNDVCADCKNHNPRWASHSLGIFICMNCASIHRKMGTHISKVKSLTMDTWSKEQVEFMKSMGNTKSNAHYNPNETRNPPPTNMIDQERDSELEKYIRSKYQYKSFVTRSAQVAALLGPSRSASSKLSSAAQQRSATMPPSASSSSSLSSISKPSVAPPLTASSSTASASSVASAAAPAQSQLRSNPISNLAVSQYPGPQLSNIPTNTHTQLPQQSIYMQPQQQPQPPQQSSNPLWNDLAQLQAPSTNSSLPLQFTSLPTIQPMNVPAPNGGNLTLPNPFSGLSTSPNNPFPSSLASQPTGMGMFSGGPPRSMSLNSGMSTMSLGAMPSPSFQHQPGLSTPTTLLPQTPLTAPSPSPFVPSSFQSTGFQASFAQPLPAASSSFTQPLFNPQPQPSPMFQPQPQPQPSPMYPNHPFGVGQPGTPQPQMGNPFALSATHQPFSSPQTQAFAGSPSPAPFMQHQHQHQHQQQHQQQQPQQMFGQQGMGMGMGGMQGMQGMPMSGMPTAGPTGAFGGTGWGQQPGFPGQQQQQPWGGM